MFRARPTAVRKWRQAVRSEIAQVGESGARACTLHEFHARSAAPSVLEWALALPPRAHARGYPGGGASRLIHLPAPLPVFPTSDRCLCPQRGTRGFPVGLAVRPGLIASLDHERRTRGTRRFPELSNSGIPPAQPGVYQNAIMSARSKNYAALAGIGPALAARKTGRTPCLPHSALPK